MSRFLRFLKHPRFSRFTWVSDGASALPSVNRFGTEKSRSGGDDDSFLVEKIRRIYSKKDQNGDGLVEQRDFEEWGEKASKLIGAELTDEAREAWIRAYNLWYGENKTFEPWKDFILKMAENEIENTIAYGYTVNQPLFKTVDVDEDGTISFDEYKAFVMPLGATEAECKVGFEMIDTNADGILSYEEFNHALVMYYFDKNNSKYKHFYGEYK